MINHSNKECYGSEYLPLGTLEEHLQILIEKLSYIY